MEMPSSNTIAQVKSVLVSTLGIEERADSLHASTPLFGSLPELDSMAVVEVVYALEERFAITISDEEFSADMFESLGALASFIDAKLR